MACKGVVPPYITYRTPGLCPLPLLGHLFSVPIGNQHGAS
jgi:hypothetical protein